MFAASYRMQRMLEWHMPEAATAQNVLGMRCGLAPQFHVCNFFPHVMQVCGTDGQTYDNICELRSNSANVRVDYDGACEDDDEDEVVIDKCARLRRSNRCADVAPTCTSRILPEDGCCPVCGEESSSIPLPYSPSRPPPPFPSPFPPVSPPLPPPPPPLLPPRPSQYQLDLGSLKFTKLHHNCPCRWSCDY